jgi:creatinine amidohydrolase
MLHGIIDSVTKLPHRFWHQLTWKEFAALDARRVIAVLPVGAVEQHGPHLPVAVDAAVVDAVVRRALDLLAFDVPVLALPTLPVGKSNEHLGFPGTLSLSAETLLRLWMEVGESVARAGVRKLAIVNSHGGQRPVVDVVARDLRVGLGMLVVAVDISALGLPQGLFDDEEVRVGIHAGAIETSVMLAIDPDLVHRDELRNFPPSDTPEESRDLTATGPVRFGWQMQDLHPDGACGDARDADAERGRRVIDHAAGRLAAILQQMDRYPLQALRPRP